MAWRLFGSQSKNDLCKFLIALQWRQIGRVCVSNHQPQYCLLNRLFRRRSKKTSKLRVTGLCAGNSPVAGEFPAQKASNAENVSIFRRHHENNHSHVPPNLSVFNSTTPWYIPPQMRADNWWKLIAAGWSLVQTWSNEWYDSGLMISKYKISVGTENVLVYRDGFQHKLGTCKW